MKNVKELEKALDAFKCRSAWDRGVNDYAFMLLEDYKEALDFGISQPINKREFEIVLLSTMKDWEEFSYYGKSLIYDGQIAETLCSEPELNRTQHGRYPLNNCDSWMDLQAKALQQAFNRLAYLAFNC